MKFKFIAMSLLASCLIANVSAVEWTSKSGVGIRGPLISPLLKGGDFEMSEPFMMGWDGTFYLRHGFSHSFVVDLSLGYAKTYDDTTADSDMSFSLSNSDNAYSKLEGMLFSLTGSFYTMTGGGFQPYVLAGIGIDSWRIKNYPGSQAYYVNDLAARMGAGLNLWMGESFTIDVQGRFSIGLVNLSRHGSTTAYRQGDWSEWDKRPFRAFLEPSIGLTYYVGKEHDTDGDGVKDKLDSCPDTPLGAVVDQSGCPIDSDGDGVYDGLDLCANTPARAVVDISGCPLDSDGDGVYDGLDQCPNTPAGAPIDLKGCPLDTDGDGVFDYKDKQPATPKGAIVDEWGVALDTDNDGVYDGLDKCPTTEAGVEVDKNGCPVDVKPPTTKITLHISYTPGSYEPDVEAKAVLDELARTLRAYVGTKIEINGFTDSQGAEEFNMTLSQKRAEAVMNYLLSQGIESDRMKAQGFGENPAFFIGDNGTAQGRKENRRVEIISIEW
jgi:outer membrane protein OmpA-like peptidoglycan-associated protein